MLPRLEQAGINVKVIAAISEELFDRQPEAYRNAVLPAEARQDLMFVMSGTRRMSQLRNVGSLTDDYSLTSDWGNHLADRWARIRRDRGGASGRRSRFAVQRFARSVRRGSAPACAAGGARGQGVGRLPAAGPTAAFDRRNRRLGIDHLVHRIAIEAFRVLRGLPGQELQYPGEARDEREMPGPFDDNVFRPSGSAFARRSA